MRGVRYILGKYDVKLRGRRRINGYKVDEDFFKRWSNEMAYVLGFIYTDGSVNSNTLTISQNERYILERINEVMASNCVISESDNGKNTLYTLYIHRKEIRSEEHTSELQSRGHLVCRLLLEKKKK